MDKATVNSNKNDESVKVANLKRIEAYLKNKNTQPLVAYFSMEFGLHEDFKIYSGGLGILAGDVLKAARDGEYPLVGIGILWRQGYTTQYIDNSGFPYDSFYEYHYDFLRDTGVVVSVNVRDREVKCKVWECTNYRNNPLYLLDANLPENNDRLITGQLYGWFSEERIAQEIILGIGGIKALRALGIVPDRYHFNDSHPVLAGVELIREDMEQLGMSFEEAWENTRKKVVFTTHTPVSYGNEEYDHKTLKYMGAYNGLSYSQMVKLGGNPFGMTVAGLRFSNIANAVSELHGHTARKMWKKVKKSAPIISITNGVHNGTWQDKRINIDQDDEKIWNAHMQAKEEMIEDVKNRTGTLLDKSILTIGFARRASHYKRGDLIFTNEVLIEKLLDGGKLQIIFSGKAHPNDLEGKSIIAKLFSMAHKYSKSVVFVQNYDMQIAKKLTAGCDVWLNNPLRPLEASGTSGMKAAMNGVLNFSVLDGWWPEGCEHGVNGWQIGEGYQGKDQNEVDANSLYEVLVNEVLPTYYENRKKWVGMMRSSISMSEKKFSAARMVEEYYKLIYKKL